MSFYLNSVLPHEARHNVVSSYYDALPEREKFKASQVASQISSLKPLADTVAIIPVAAHQEAAQIPNTLEQYARQSTDRPFSVVVGLNYPQDKSNHPGIARTIEAVEVAKEAHPNLDVRTSFMVYPPSPVIGQIRRDLWNGVVKSALDHDCIDNKRTIVGLNQDIDLYSMWPNTIQRVQAEYSNYFEDNNRLLPVLGIQMTHGIDRNYPNITRAVRWSDFLVRQGGGTFEAALTIPLEMYALSGGMDASTSYGEVYSRVGIQHWVIRGTHAVTSPRRYLERFHVDGLEVWDADKFSAFDAYRTAEKFKDASLQQSLNAIHETIPKAAKNMNDRAIEKAASHHRMFKELGITGATYQRFIEYGLTRNLIRKNTVYSRALQNISGSPQLVSYFMKEAIANTKNLEQRVAEIVEAA